MANITMASGDNLDVIYTIRDQDGVIVDLTGGSLTWDALVSGATTKLIEKSSPSSGIALTDPTNGVATVTLNPADTSSLKGTYLLDGEFTDSSSNKYTFEQEGLIIS